MWTKRVFGVDTSRRDQDRNLRWERRDSVGLDPGIPKLNDANIVLLRVVTSVVDPELGKRIEAEAKTLHQSSMKGLSLIHI